MAWTPKEEREMFQAIGRLGFDEHELDSPIQDVTDLRLINVLCDMRDLQMAEAMAATDQLILASKTKDMLRLDDAMVTIDALCEENGLEKPFGESIGDDDALRQAEDYALVAGNESERKARQYAHASVGDDQVHHSTMLTHAMEDPMRRSWSEGLNDPAEGIHRTLLPKSLYEFQALASQTGDQAICNVVIIDDYPTPTGPPYDNQGNFEALTRRQNQEPERHSGPHDFEPEGVAVERELLWRLGANCTPPLQDNYQSQPEWELKTEGLTWAYTCQNQAQEFIAASKTLIDMAKRFEAAGPDIDMHDPATKVTTEAALEAARTMQKTYDDFGPDLKNYEFDPSLGSIVESPLPPITKTVLYDYDRRDNQIDRDTTHMAQYIAQNYAQSVDTDDQRRMTRQALTVLYGGQSELGLRAGEAEQRMRESMQEMATSLMPQRIDELARQEFPNADNPVEAFTERAANDAYETFRKEVVSLGMPEPDDAKELAAMAKLESLQQQTQSAYDGGIEQRNRQQQLELANFEAAFDDMDLHITEGELVRQIVSQVPLEEPWSTQVPSPNSPWSTQVSSMDPSQREQLLDHIVKSDDATVVREAVEHTALARDDKLTTLFESSVAITAYMDAREDPGVDQTTLASMQDIARSATYEVEGIYKEYGLDTDVDDYAKQHGLMDEGSRDHYETLTRDEYLDERMSIYASLTAIQPDAELKNTTQFGPDVIMLTWPNQPAWADEPATETDGITRNALAGHESLQAKLATMGVTDVPAPDLAACMETAKENYKVTLQETIAAKGPLQKAPDEPAPAPQDQNAKSTEAIRGVQSTAPTKAHKEDALSM